MQRPRTRDQTNLAAPESVVGVTRPQYYTLTEKIFAGQGQIQQLARGGAQTS